MSETEAMSIQCCRHGPGIAAVVCGHLAGSGASGRGFVENSSEPEDLQGWCGACEDFFDREGEMTEAFRAFNNMAIVCTACYHEIKAANEQVGA
jgi:hypothetical protein